MGFGLAGAMAGAGGAALDSLQAREKSYLEEKRAEKLAELRHKQELQTLQIQELINGKKIDKGLTEFTDTGVIFKNDNGDTIGERAYNPAELKARQEAAAKAARDAEKDVLDIDGKRISNQREKQAIGLDAGRYNLAVAESKRGGGRRGGGGSDDDPGAPTGNTDEDIAAKIVYNNVKAADAARKAGVPENIIQDTALRVIGNMRAMRDTGNKPNRSVSYGFNVAMDHLVKATKTGKASWANYPLDKNKLGD